jgi:hypothetical protein
MKEKNLRYDSFKMLLLDIKYCIHTCCIVDFLKPSILGPIWFEKSFCFHFLYSLLITKILFYFNFILFSNICIGNSEK